MNNATNRRRKSFGYTLPPDEYDDLTEDGFAGMIEDALYAYVNQADDAPVTQVSNTNETFRPNAPYATPAHLRVRIGDAEFLVAVSRVD